MRKLFKGGLYRHPISIVLGLVVAFIAFYFWGFWIDNKMDPFGAGQKVAFIVAAFSVTAYNLRVRIIDLIMKINVSPATYRNLKNMAECCSRKLSNLVLLFTITALFLGVLGFIPNTAYGTGYIFAIAAFLFTYSLIQFLYILFSFETLEDYILNEFEKVSIKKEADRLLPK